MPLPGRTWERVKRTGSLSEHSLVPQAPPGNAHWEGEAEPLYRRSLAIREQQLGPDHLVVATSLNNLAGLYDSQGRYGEAEPLYRRSLVIREHQLGAEHPAVATSLNNLAGLYDSQGRYGEAEPLYLRSLTILFCGSV
jgi:tetratricopeptide (TPR) repeat protein